MTMFDVLGLVFIAFIFIAVLLMLLNRRNSIKKRSAWEEKIYKQVVSDLEKDDKRAGLWKIAMDESNGSENLCKSIYIKYCVQSIIGEHEILNTVKL